MLNQGKQQDQLGYQVLSTNALNINFYKPSKIWWILYYGEETWKKANIALIYKEGWDLTPATNIE